MRCFSCDCELTDFEATRKSKVTEEYIDLCESCFSEVQDMFIEVDEREDLKIFEEIKDDL